MEIWKEDIHMNATLKDAFLSIADGFVLKQEHEWIVVKVNLAMDKL